MCCKFDLSPINFEPVKIWLMSDSSMDVRTRAALSAVLIAMLLTRW